VTSAIEWQQRVGVPMFGAPVALQSDRRTLQVRFRTDCGWSGLAGECRRAQFPALGAVLRRSSAVHRNVPSSADLARGQVNHLATMRGQRLLPMAG